MIFHIESRDGQRPSGVVTRWLSWFAIGCSAALITITLMIVATAVAVIALLGALLMAGLRLASKRAASGGDPPDVLEARRTADGWVVEPAPHPR